MTLTPGAARRLALVLSCGSIVVVAATCGGSGARPGAPATPLAANRAAEPAPRRPALPPGADTCDPNAYSQFAWSQLRQHPAVAAAAFYWMQRLSPNEPLAYYSERVALLLADKSLLRGYIEGNRRILQSAKVRRIDSLQVRAITLDPFFPQFLDENLIVTYYTYVIGNRVRGQVESSAGLRDEQIEAYVRNELTDHADSATRAWLAYARGDYRVAADYWADSLRRDSADTDLRARRSKALFLGGKWDSAHAELEATLRTARRSDARTMKYVYDSKVLWEYELGWIDELEKRDSAAREEYQSALVEDLSFYPAHLRLAYLALRARDTTTTVTELQRVIEIKDDDFSSRLLLGAVLTARRQFGPATDHLRRAVEIEPWVAYPHFVLGNVRREAGDVEGAASEYRRFLALAPQSDPNVPAARQRLAAVSAPAP
jgi:tetratricopeptide (TPR) repeat protein